jgi:hypothetical protein
MFRTGPRAGRAAFLSGPLSPSRNGIYRRGRRTVYDEDGREFGEP